MFNGLCDAEGIMYIEFMQKGITINSENYCNTLQKLKVRVRRIRPLCITFLLHHDNTKCEKVVPHPPCSPDLASKDFHHFSKLKESIQRTKFDSYEEIQYTVQLIYQIKVRSTMSTVFMNGFVDWKNVYR